MFKTEHPFFVRRFWYTRRSVKHFVRYGRAPDFPLVLQLQTQSSCNAHCSICPYSRISDQIPHGFMEPSLFEKIAGEAGMATSFVELILMLQNEPLLDRRIFELVRAVKRAPKHIKCTLCTNGELLDQFSLESIASSGVDHIMVSLNASSKEVFNRINNGIEFERVLENIERLLADKRLRSKVIVKFVVLEQNREDVENAVRYWLRRGVRIHVSNVSNRGGFLDHFERIKPVYATSPAFTRMREWATRFAISRGLGVCPFPFFLMCILYNGDVITCCNDWGRTPIVGDVAHDSLRAIWNSSKMNAMRTALVHRDYRAIASCSHCSMLDNFGPD